MHDSLEEQLEKKLAEAGIPRWLYDKYQCSFEELPRDLQELQKHLSETPELKKQFEAKKKQIELKITIIKLYLAHRTAELNTQRQHNLQEIELLSKHEIQAKKINPQTIESFMALDIHKGPIDFDGFINAYDHNSPLQEFQRFLKSRSLLRKIIDFFTGRHHLFRQYEHFLKQYCTITNKEPEFLKHYQTLENLEKQTSNIRRKYEVYALRNRITTTIEPSNMEAVLERFNSFSKKCHNVPRLKEFQIRVITNQHYFCERYKVAVTDMLTRKKEFFSDQNRDIDEQHLPDLSHQSTALPGIEIRLQHIQKQRPKTPVESKEEPIKTENPKRAVPTLCQGQPRPLERSRSAILPPPILKKRKGEVPPPNSPEEADDVHQQKRKRISFADVGNTVTRTSSLISPQDDHSLQAAMMSPTVIPLPSKEEIRRYINEANPHVLYAFNQPTEQPTKQSPEDPNESLEMQVTRVNLGYSPQFTFK